jgi:YggT family protein
VNIFIIPFLKLVHSLLEFYNTIILVSFVLDLLRLFNLINFHNHFIQTIDGIITRLTEPILSKIRAFIPHLGGIDFSPMILLLGISFLQNIITQLLVKISL